MVDENQVPFSLPNMRVNPFNIKPINSSEKDLLVGRKEIISKIISWCKHRSSRMLLLIGNRGTGRTSLLNLLGNQAYRHFQFNIFPTKDPMKRLLEELYITVVSDFEVPRLTQQLQENLIKSIPKTGRLPILSFDYPNIHGSEISDVFKQISQIIRSLDAVSIIVLTPAQLATWPQELIDEFDEEIEIKNFNNEEIFQMVGKRVKSTSRNNWDPPQKLIDEIEERTSGHPSESIKLMRKIVHAIKSEQGYDNELEEIFKNIKPEINQKTYSETEVKEHEEVFEKGFEELEIEEFGDYDNINIEDEIILEVEGSNFEEIKNADFQNDNFEPLAEEPKNIVLFQDKIEAPLPKGGFGKLGGRTRDTNELMRKEGYAVFPSDYETMKNIQDPPSLESPTLETENVALWIDEKSVENTELKEKLRGFSSLSENNNLIHKHEKIQEVTFESALKDMQTQEPLATNEQAFDLNIEKLRQLDENEIKVIRLSANREISPSDAEMRSMLGGIGRTRLSQIFNGLNKQGILSVKKVGRSRMFYLSTSAKSQLKAWGIL